MSETLIKVEGVSKKFSRSLKKSLWYGLQDLGREITGRQHGGDGELRTDEFWAVKDLSFELKRGECLGLIGRNGAGKTTLLKMLNGLIKPDAGSIAMRGRVSALIALGAGFNPILSGRENIYVNGSVLGLSKTDINAKIDEIIDFAEIGEFIDSPVQSYSSGMHVRLGFAIATSLEPDVLILDEVLAVGDAAFRSKCYRKIVAIREQAAVIFVSHNMEQIARICDRTLVMAKGKCISIGSIDDGAMAYERLNDHSEDKDEAFLTLSEPMSDFSYVLERDEIESGDSMLLRIRYCATHALDCFLLRITFYNPSGGLAADCNLDSRSYGIEIQSGEHVWEINIASISLRRGNYKLAINIISATGNFVVWSYKQANFKVLDGYSGAATDYQLRLERWIDIKKNNELPID